MERRKSLAKLFPEVQITPPSPRSSRKTSTVARPEELANLKDKRSNSAERSSNAQEIMPPMRRASTAITPLSLLEEDYRKRQKAMKGVAPGGGALLHPKYRHSTSVPPRLSELDEYVKQDSGSGKRNAISKTQLKSILSEINKSGATGPSNEIPIREEEKAISEEDAKKLHSSLRKSFENKEIFKFTMVFQPRKKGDTVRSHDSGVGPFDDDESVVECWKQRWSKTNAESGPDEVKSIKGLCFTMDNSVAISEDKGARIQIFDRKNGNSVRILREGFHVNLVRPAGICQLRDKNFLAIADQKRVVYMEPSDRAACEFKVFERQEHLHGIAVNTRQQLIVTDKIKKRAYLYELDGKRILRFNATDFVTPNYVTVSDEYSLAFVSDSDQRCIYVLNMDGDVLHKIGKDGDNNEKLIYPMGVCCLQNGKLAVADRGQHRVLTYDFRARCCEHLLTQEDLLRNPTCIASDGYKYLAVAEESHDYKVNEYGVKLFTKFRSVI